MLALFACWPSRQDYSYALNIPRLCLLFTCRCVQLKIYNGAMVSQSRLHYQLLLPAPPPHTAGMQQHSGWLQCRQPCNRSKQNKVNCTDQPKPKLGPHFRTEQPPTHQPTHHHPLVLAKA